MNAQNQKVFLLVQKFGSWFIIYFYITKIGMLHPCYPALGSLYGFPRSSFIPFISSIFRCPRDYHDVVCVDDRLTPGIPRGPRAYLSIARRGNIPISNYRVSSHTIRYTQKTPIRRGDVRMIIKAYPPGWGLHDILMVWGLCIWQL